MTQAPTPGPLSGDYSVEEYVAEYEFRGDEGSHTPNDDERALITDAIHGYLSEASYRLAPTAPVEASGSERDEIAKVLRERVQIGGTDWDKSAYSADMNAEEVADAILALRPQPSGETSEIDLYDDRVQEGIAWTMRQWGETLGLTTWTQGDGSESVEGDVGAEIHTILSEAGLRDPETNEMATLSPQPSGGEGDRERIAKIIDPEAFVPMGDVIGMRKAFVKADAILALPSARPLALGGQHSGGEGEQ